MIIVPDYFIMLFLLGRSYSHQALDQLMGRLRETTKKDDAKKLRGMLLQICRSSLSQTYKSDEARNLYLGPVAVNAAFLRDASLFAKVVEQIPGSLEKDCYRALGELICLQSLAVQEHE